MTTPNLGDLPDWQALVAPNILLSTSISQSAGANVVVASAPNPLRLWGAWMDVSIASANAFVGGPSVWGANLQDDNGTVYLRIACHLAVANQNNRGQQYVDFKGIVIPTTAGAARFRFVTDANITNVFVRASCGVLVSNP
jgi:hypothetical protein